MDLRGYLFTPAGVAVNGATVEVFQGASGTPTDTTTTNADGMWEFTGLANGFTYRVEATSGSQLRMWWGDNKIQFETIVGLDGVTAPLLNASIDEAMLKANVVENTVITIDPAQDPTDNATTVQLGFGEMANQVKEIKGTTNWYDAPAKSIATINTDLADIDTHVHDGVSYPYIDLDYLTNAITADVTLSGTTYATGPQVTLTVGTWLVSGVVLIKAGTTDPGTTGLRFDGKMWDASATVWSSGGTLLHEGAWGQIAFPPVVIVVAAGTKTCRLSVRNSAAQTFLTNSIIDDEAEITTGDYASQITAVRIV